MKSLLEFLSGYINKTLILIIICILLGAGAVYHISGIIVTEEVFAKELQNVQVQIKLNNNAVTKKILVLRQGMLEQQVWDLDARVDDALNSVKKAKWIRRLKRTENKLKDIEEQIQELENDNGTISN